MAAARSSSDAAAALEAAYDFLALHPIENSLVLSLLRERVARPEPGRYWWAVDGGEVVGFAFQSPLHMRAVVAPAGRRDVDVLVDAIAEDAPDLPGVTGDAATAAAFAGRWAEQRAVPAVPVEGQRIYRLRDLRQPTGVAGTLRLAGDHDRERLAGWARGFLDETGMPGMADQVLDRHLASGLWVWEAGEPVSMAVASSPTDGVARIGFVYTPPEHRGRGYAGACVAAASARVVAGGATCMLYTQLHNPTSNAVYRRIGYEPVTEVLVYRFTPRPGPRGGEAAAAPGVGSARSAEPDDEVLPPVDEAEGGSDGPRRQVRPQGPVAHDGGDGQGVGDHARREPPG